MNRITKLVLDLEKRKHPSTCAFSREEMKGLIENLRNRLDLPSTDLNISPTGLRKLESLLSTYYKQIAKSGDIFNDDFVVTLVREIAAFLGEVILTYTDATLEDYGSLWSTHLIISDRVTVSKEGKSQITNGINMSLGNLASIALDRIEADLPPNLYKSYRSAKSKSFIETYE